MDDKMNEKIKSDAINPEVVNERNNRTNTFNLVIGIATLLIALLGATFAYFSATARGKENDVMVKSANVSISYDGGTEIKASNLIPATQQVALKKYQKVVQPYDPDVDGEINLDYDTYRNDVERRCVDAKGKEVCYVYQFSVTSDGTDGGTTDIIASIKVNKNEFTNLSYLLYEVNFEEDSEGNVVKDKYGFGLINSYSLVSKFDMMDTNPDNVDYTGVGFNKFERPEDIFGENNELINTVNPVACLFVNSNDFADKEKDDTSRCGTYAISNNVKHTYQLVIWLEETGSVQEEQGLTFEGTVAIEVSGGLDTSEYGNGQITGQE